ncbi:SHOCT domain-containing protein [Clostridium sp.]|uniref:SHOCT domain-containing protein n=1 Tax=Clostridium sp. TaxID=1506 RepID=UPI002A7FF0A5|nr:SHOCT domain-containing protein [Clostridium sp.]MDY4252496.1 SHOCT domain-containing protein [Clostridium sp.]
MFENMFENIGGKIKTLAKILCWVGIILSVLIAMILFIEAKEGSYKTEDLYMNLGCIYLIFGPLVSWVSSFFIYGFGELIERTTEISLNTRHLRQASGYKEKTEREKTLDELLAAGLITETEYNEKMKE